jgi:hypothetical protein
LSDDAEAIMAADDPGYLSPVDGHMHYAIAAMDECAVCMLETERDQLRDQLDRFVATAKRTDHDQQQRIRELEDSHAALSRRHDDWRDLADRRAAAETERDRLLDGVCTCPRFGPETTPFTLYDTGCPVHGQHTPKESDDGTGMVVADLRDDRQPGVRGDALAPPVDGDVSDERFIEFTAIIGPIEPPHALHVRDQDGTHDTVHGRLARRLFEAVVAIDPHADMSAHVTTEAKMQARHDAVAERDRTRAVVEAVHQGAPYITKTGKVLTDADIHTLAEQAEHGSDAIASITLAVWQLINQHADQITGTDRNVITAWLDWTIRPALFGTSEDVYDDRIVRDLPVYVHTDTPDDEDYLTDDEARQQTATERGDRNDTT